MSGQDGAIDAATSGATPKAEIGRLALAQADAPEEESLRLAKPPPASPPDVMSMLLADKRSENTKRAYAFDLTLFFKFCYGREPSVELVSEFLARSTGEMVRLILQYKAAMLEQKLAEATINRRLAAIMSLVRFAQRLGATEANPKSGVDGERVVAYRDTRGIVLDQARALLNAVDASDVKGRRDRALLLILLENALRRAEIAALSVKDLDLDARSLWINGKGRGSQRERITLSTNAVGAIRDYLELSGHAATNEAPLFLNVSPAYVGRRLTPDGIYKIVQQLAKQAGLTARISPHRLRHTAITLALDAAQGDIRKVQRLSRHAQLETLKIYDDNRRDLQGEVTDLLSSLLED